MSINDTIGYNIWEQSRGNDKKDNRIVRPSLKMICTHCRRSGYLIGNLFWASEVLGFVQKWMGKRNPKILGQSAQETPLQIGINQSTTTSNYSGIIDDVFFSWVCQEVAKALKGHGIGEINPSQTLYFTGSGFNSWPFHRIFFCLWTCYAWLDNRHKGFKSYDPLCSSFETQTNTEMTHLHQATYW